MLCLQLEDVHPSETWRAMEELLKLPDNPVRSIGLANFNSAQIKDILEKGSVTPAVNQVECNAYFNQEKLKAFLMLNNITMVAYSPLGSPYRPWAKKNDPILLKDRNLIKIGEKYGGKTAAQVALRYLVRIELSLDLRDLA